MKLSAPTFLVFVISLVIAIVAVVAGLVGFSIPVLGAFYTLLIAYVLLVLGVLLKGF